MNKRICCAGLTAVLLASHVAAQPASERPTSAAAGLESIPRIATIVSGSPRLPRERAVTLEYAGSVKLTEVVRRGLGAEGIQVVDQGVPDAVSARVRGVLQLTGKHTARIRIEDLAEKGTVVTAADGPRTLAPADLGYVIAAGDWLTRLVSAGQLSAPAGGILLIDVVGQATGAKDWFNKAVGGDRRGICLVNCENWNKTRQAAYHVIDIRDGSEGRRAEVKSELLAEDLQPGRVVSAGLTALIDALSGKQVISGENLGAHDARTSR
jgi:hypothetical protein